MESLDGVMSLVKIHVSLYSMSEMPVMRSKEKTMMKHLKGSCGEITFYQSASQKGCSWRDRITYNKVAMSPFLFLTDQAYNLGHHSPLGEDCSTDQ